MKQFLTNASLFFVTTAMSVCFIVPTVFGQEQAPASANPSLADSLSAKVDKIFAQWDKPDSPGCALGVIRDGQLIYKRGYGMANLDYDIPISANSVFDIGSISKQFTAMSVLLLSKQGKLSLDDEIQEYLPEFPRYQSPITISHLIHHTSGLRDVGLLAELAGMRRENVYLTFDDFFRLLARQKELNHNPGEEFAYTNSGYFLLGLIVKRISGTSLRAFAEENIFKPLGMNNTHFHDDRTLIVKNRVTAYLPEDDGRFSVEISITESGLYTTVEDLFLWDQNFYNNKLGGGPNLISDALSGSVLNSGETITYAFGIGFSEYIGLKRDGHGGGGPGFVLEMQRYPEQNFSVICLCNLVNINPRRLANRVADIFLADQFEQDEEVVEEIVEETPVVVNVPEEELAALTGLYFDPIRIDLHRFYMKDGKLMFEPNIVGWEVELLPLGQHRFGVVGLPYKFVFTRPDVGGPWQETSTDLRSGVGYTFDAVETLTSDLVEYTGEYRSDELPGATYALNMKGGKLRLLVRNGTTAFSDRGLRLAFTQPSKSEAAKDLLLTPLFEDFFSFSVGGIRFTLTFTRNQQNAVSGFTLTTQSGVRNLRFNKL